MEVLKLQAFGKKDALKTFVTLAVVDEAVKHIGTLFEIIKHRFTKRVVEKVTPRKLPLAHDSILLEKKHEYNQVFLKRDWKTRLESFQETNCMVDAVLSVISKLDNVPKLQLIENAHILISYREKPVQVTKDIYVKVEEFVRDSETNMLSTVTLVLVSNTISASEILKWVRSVYVAYREQIKNALGDTLYYFDQKAGPDPGGDPRGSVGLDESMKAAQKSMKLLTAPKQLSFVKTPFYSNKTFKNIFGQEVREVEDRVNFFLNSREWYDQRGIPYQLGLLLSGLPGTGKTSIIRAVANLTKRHIINVNFSSISTATQLKNLFFNEKLTVYTDSSMSTYDVLTIPIQDRIYVLEEIDALTNVVKQRVPGAEKEDPLPDELTLGEILTALDGTLETPGRIVIMTSNHPEVLDKALIRPGRIDVAVKFGHAKRRLIEEMYTCFFGRSFTPRDLDLIPDEKLTAAEVGQIMFRHLKNPDGVLQDLIASSQTRVEPPEEAKVKPHPPTWEPEGEDGSSSLAEWDSDKDCFLFGGEARMVSEQMFSSQIRSRPSPP
jgi:AAA+ superfamily predicted ATPase